MGYRCNICESVVITTEKSPELLGHIKTDHKEVYDLHKENPEATVGFRIEFLQLNTMLKDDIDPKSQPIMFGEVCETAGEEIIQPITDKDDETLENTDASIILVPKKKKKIKHAKTDASLTENRRRSWVWKYFHRMSNIIFRCTICNVVLSIKGCNTNNMNRHVRTRHPSIFDMETEKKRRESAEHLDLTEVETPYAIKTEEICASEKDLDESLEASSNRHRRSWIWLYFNRTSATSAQCKLCNRHISHGGNATGNMNRHLKMIHHKTGDDYTWIWKVFENADDDFYTCKICQYQCSKFTEMEKSISNILQHLRVEHGVVSGDQIITGTDDGDEEEVH